MEVGKLIDPWRFPTVNFEEQKDKKRPTKTEAKIMVSQLWNKTEYSRMGWI